MISRTFLRSLSVSFLAMLPGVAAALEDRSIEVNTGFRLSLGDVFSNLYGFLAASIVMVSTVLFLVGGFFLILSHGDSNLVDKGKKIMIGSVIGLMIVLGAYAIERTVLFILYT